MSQSTRLSLTFHAERAGPRIVFKKGDASKPGAQGHIPRVSRLVALAHKFQGLLDDGTVDSLADLARLGRVTRARITQIMDCLLLAPDIQEELLFLPSTTEGWDPVALRTIRYVCQTPLWQEQRKRWAELKETFDP